MISRRSLAERREQIITGERRERVNVLVDSRYVSPPGVMVSVCSSFAGKVCKAIPSALLVAVASPNFTVAPAYGTPSGVTVITIMGYASSELRAEISE